jgi:hypothetical protein
MNDLGAGNEVQRGQGHDAVAAMTSANMVRPF